MTKTLSRQTVWVLALSLVPFLTLIVQLPIPTVIWGSFNLICVLAAFGFSLIQTIRENSRNLCSAAALLISGFSLMSMAAFAVIAVVYHLNGGGIVL